MVFTPATAETVEAARSTAELAARNRKAECGPNNETRGSRCRERETDEQAKSDALAKALANKAATDSAAKTAGEAAALRSRLAEAQPAPAPNALGRVLGRFLSVSAMTAATFQQGFVSAIVELLIAAVLALPELLRSHQPRPAGCRLQPAATTAIAEILPPAETSTNFSVLPKGTQSTSRRVRTHQAIASLSDTAVPVVASDDEIDPKPVVAFLAQHMPADRGSRADWGDIYGGFLAWQTERGGNTLPASEFGAVLRHICEQAGIRVRRQGERVYCMDRRVTWK
jgi:hypothetical protein